MQYRVIDRIPAGRTPDHDASEHKLVRLKDGSYVLIPRKKWHAKAH